MACHLKIQATYAVIETPPEWGSPDEGNPNQPIRVPEYQPPQVENMTCVPWHVVTLQNLTSSSKYLSVLPMYKPLSQPLTCIGQCVDMLLMQAIAHVQQPHLLHRCFVGHMRLLYPSTCLHAHLRLLVMHNNSHSQKDGTSISILKLTMLRLHLPEPACMLMHAPLVQAKLYCMTSQAFSSTLEGTLDSVSHSSMHLLPSCSART